MSTVHAAAQKGFTAEGAAAYEKGRPIYIPGSLAHIVDIIKNNSFSDISNISIVELGSGTGKFTESLAPYVVSNGTVQLKQYLATEPSEGFRAVLAGKNLPNVVAIHGTGESIPAETNSVDVVVVAQAFHWMDNQTTLNEIHRVLKPNGVLAMIWNTYDYSVDWVMRLENEILGPAYGDVPRQQSENWRKCFFTDKAKRMFTPLHGWYEPFHHTGDRDLVFNRIFSTSVIVNKTQEGQNDVRKVLNNILDTPSELAESRRTGVYKIPYITCVVSTYALK